LDVKRRANVDKKTKTIKLRSRSHFNRVVGELETNSLNDLKQAIDNGCSVQKVKYTLRYPEVMICDLSNPEFPLNLCDSQTIYDCFILIEIYGSTINSVGEGKNTFVK